VAAFGSSAGDARLIARTVDDTDAHEKVDWRNPNINCLLLSLCRDA